jgi:putative endonuclease
MHFVYILKSDKYNKYYIGQTKNVDERLKRHNTGRSVYTRKFMPWKIVYSEKYNTKAEAYKREMEIKSYKSGFLFKRLIREI